MKCFAYKGAISSRAGDQFTDRVIVCAITMPRYLLVAALTSALACGGSSPKTETSTTSTPVTTPKGDTTSDVKDVEGSSVDASRKAKVPVTSAPITIPNGLVYKGYILGGLPTKDAIDAAISKDIESAISLMASDEPGISEIGPYAA
jgi:hypothetical protein